jgi:hypothetical protein
MVGLAAVGRRAALTLDELRQRFWWLGASRTQSHIVALENNRVTVEITHHTWNRRTERYERSVERGFGALGLAVAWQRRWSGALQQEIDKARASAAEGGEAFDEAAFIATKPAEERARIEREGEAGE